MSHSTADIFFRVFPLLLLGFSYFCYVHFKGWLKVWNLPDFKYKKILKIYRILMFVFVLPWLIFTILGIGRSITPPEWLNIIYVYPCYIWQLTNITLFFILIPYDLVKYPVKLFNNIVRKYRKIEAVDNEKRHSLKKALITVPGALATFVAFGVYNSEFDHIVNRIQIKIKDLPENLKGLTITQISDLHFGPFMDGEKFAKYAKIINDIGSDIIVITGDIINSSRELIDQTKLSLAGLRAKGGIYACLGNHEHFIDPWAIKHNFESIGINVLVNEHRLMKINEEEFYLVGIDYPMRNIMKEDLHTVIKRHLDKTVSQLYNDDGRARILLAHHPETFSHSPDYKMDLTLSGHTHGGQIYLGSVGDTKLSLGQLGYKFVKGYYQQDNSHLYVNSGLGHWLPIRVNCPPEINQMILV